MKLIPPAVERAFYAVVQPLVDGLIRSGIHPNTITTVGTGFVLVSAVAYGFGQAQLGGLLLLLSGVADTLDGQVARRGAMVTRFGAFYDSTLDRVGDGATFIGIGAYFLTAPDVAYRVPAVIACMVAILSSLLVSYARARAEGLGLDCRVGIAQRAERILGLGLPSIVVGVGPHALVLEAIVALLATLSIVTVIQRFVYVSRHADPPSGAKAAGASAADAVAAGADVEEPRRLDIQARAALDTLAKGS